MIGKNFMKHYLRKKIFTATYLNMEDITDADYKHAKSVCKDVEIKVLGKYHVTAYLSGLILDKFA